MAIPKTLQIGIRWIQAKAESFRSRTAIALLLTVLTVGLTVGALLRLGVRFALQRNVDVVLQEDSEDLLDLLRDADLKISHELDVELNRRAYTHQLHRWFLRVIDGSGQRIWETNSAPKKHPIPLFPVNSNPDQLFDIHMFRVCQSPLGESPQGDQYFLQIGSRVDNLDEDIAVLDRMIIATLCVLSVLGSIGAWWLSGFLLDPVSRLTAATEVMDANSPKMRLPLRDTGDELDRLASTFNSLLDRVGHEIRRREDWLANSAHELRSPLAAISSNVEVVLSHTHDSRDRAMLERVVEQCNELRTLVNKLLLLSEADAARSRNQKTSPIRLDQLILKACEIYEPLAQSRGIQFSYDQLTPVWVEANPFHARHLVQNLIDNAIKFTPEGGQIRVSNQMERDRNVALFEVQDNGIGISASDVKRVTERFFRSDSRRSAAPGVRGSGLGLSICKSVVDGIGGTIEIQSTLGLGTCIRVHIPAKPVGVIERTHAAVLQ
jgi:signal transduction histidine kinase